MISAFAASAPTQPSPERLVLKLRFSREDLDPAVHNDKETLAEISRRMRQVFRRWNLDRNGQPARRAALVPWPSSTAP